MSDWKHVDEELPKIGERVLVSQRVNQGSPSEFRLYFDAVRVDSADDLAPEEQAFDWWWTSYDDTFAMHEFVTHWKPLDEVN